MTHSLPKGTVNISLNMLTEERQALGQIACRMGISLGALVRQMIDRSLTSIDPSIAESIRQADYRRRMARLRLT